MPSKSKKTAQNIAERKENSPEKCLTPGCNGSVVARGICNSCYISHRAAVASGNTSWLDIVDAGLALPVRVSLAALARQRSGLDPK